MIERKFINENIRMLKVVDYVRKELERAGIISVDIQRSTLATRIGIIAENPGLIIGRKGKTIQDLTAEIEKKLGIENPQIEVADVRNTSLEPRVIARWIARMLERGLKPKRVLQKAAERVMGAGAMGVEIIAKGKIQSKGAQARSERIMKGYVKKSGDSVKLIKEAFEKAILKQGIIGITVRIAPSDVIFPDKIDLKKFFEQTKKVEEVKKPEIIGEEFVHTEEKGDKKPRKRRAKRQTEAAKE
jgi:small subunit ribosomal protein S3